MIKRSLWGLFFAFCFLIVETALLSNILVLPVVPDLMLLLLVFISFYNGSVMGEVHGFFAGFMLDFLSASPLGLNSLMRVIIGFIAGLFKDVFNEDKIFFPAVLVAGATMAKGFLLIAISFFFGEKVAVYHFGESVFWIELCMNTVLAPFMFAFLRLFSTLLIESPKSSSYASK